MKRPHPDVWPLEIGKRCESHDSPDCQGTAVWFLDGEIRHWDGGGAISGRFLLCQACLDWWLT